METLQVDTTTAPAVAKAVQALVAEGLKERPQTGSGISAPGGALESSKLTVRMRLHSAALRCCTTNRTDHDVRHKHLAPKTTGCC